PRIFPLVYNIVKPIVSEDTKLKIRVLGSDFKDVLLSHIEACELPEFYGGTRTGPDGDPRCGDKIRFPTEVPVRLYAARDGDYESRLTVGLGSSHTHSLHVDTSGSIIK
ncbi:unnamed protein product, partial [Lampetra fluviatilis]